MVELINEKEYLKNEVDFSIEKKNPYVRTNMGEKVYDKAMISFNHLIKNRLDEISYNDKHTKEIKEGFRIIMETKYHNNMSIGTQIIICNNMEQLFENYLKWIISFNPNNDFYNELVNAIKRYTENPDSNDHIEDYLYIEKEQKVNKDENEHNMEVIQLPPHISEDEMILDDLENLSTKYPQNRELACMVDMFNETNTLEINKDDKEENLNKEQIVNFFKGFNPFSELMDIFENNFKALKGIKFWQMQAIVGNSFIMMNNLNSSLYKALDSILNYVFEGKELITKKDLVFDSLQAVPLEDLSIKDFFIGIQSQLSKMEYIKIFGNIINYYQQIKEVVINEIPNILQEVLNGVLDEDKQVEIYTSIDSYIKNLDQNKICEMIISDVQKSSDTPEADLKELQVITDNKEVAMNFNPIPSPKEMNIASPSYIIPFIPISEPSDLNDYEGEEGYVVGGSEPIVVTCEE